MVIFYCTRCACRVVDHHLVNVDLVNVSELSETRSPGSYQDPGPHSVGDATLFCTFPTSPRGPHVGLADHLSSRVTRSLRNQKSRDLGRKKFRSQVVTTSLSMKTDRTRSRSLRLLTEESGHVLPWVTIVVLSGTAHLDLDTHSMSGDTGGSHL